MPKNPTSKQIDAGVAQAKRKLDIEQAMWNLKRMSELSTFLTSQHTGLLRSTINSLKDQMDWLIAESDVYRDAAAKLFLGELPEPLTIDE